MTLRTIRYINPIDIPNINGFILELQKAAQDKASGVYIEMSSTGGNFDAAFKAYDFLLNYSLPVTICNVGEVSSAAIVPFMAVSKRSCLVDSKFFIHPPAWEFAPNSIETIEGLQRIINELTSYKERYAEILDRLTYDINGRKLSEYLSNESVYLSASLAAQVGICNGDIIIPRT